VSQRARRGEEPQLKESGRSQEVKKTNSGENSESEESSIRRSIRGFEHQGDPKAARSSEKLDLETRTSAIGFLTPIIGIRNQSRNLNRR
jgi:hypothetical protein